MPEYVNAAARKLTLSVSLGVFVLCAHYATWQIVSLVPGYAPPPSSSLMILLSLWVILLPCLAYAIYHKQRLVVFGLIGLTNVIMMARPSFSVDKLTAAAILLDVSSCLWLPSGWRRGLLVGLALALGLVSHDLRQVALYMLVSITAELICGLW